MIVAHWVSVIFPFSEGALVFQNCKMWIENHLLMEKAIEIKTKFGFLMDY